MHVYHPLCMWMCKGSQLLSLYSFSACVVATLNHSICGSAPGSEKEIPAHFQCKDSVNPVAIHGDFIQSPLWHVLFHFYSSLCPGSIIILLTSY